METKFLKHIIVTQPEVTVCGEQGAEGADKDAGNKQRGKNPCRFLPADRGGNPRLNCADIEKQPGKNHNGNECRNYSLDYIGDYERTPDECSGSANKLHRVDGEPAGIDGEAHRIVNEHKGNQQERQRHCG